MITKPDGIEITIDNKSGKCDLNENNIEILIAMGFNKNAALNALKNNQYNLNLARESLLNFTLTSN